MARPKIKRKGIDWKGLLSEEKDLLKAAMQDMVQEILEAEMDEALGARKSERRSARAGYRSGYYTRGVGHACGQPGIASTARPARPIQHRSVGALSAK